LLSFMLCQFSCFKHPIPQKTACYHMVFKFPHNFTPKPNFHTKYTIFTPLATKNTQFHTKYTQFHAPAYAEHPIPHLYARPPPRTLRPNTTHLHIHMTLAPAPTREN